ncbi:MAG: DEAD/DEAH box helicase [Actinobacteria bacterium]|nr:DEAD/DEAH box helicase [Actinomycetota bacterium]
MDWQATRGDRIRHSVDLPAREAVTAEWPEWAHPTLIEGYQRRGVTTPWRHQVDVAELAHAGQHVVVATGTASGKSLAFGLPTLTAVIEGSSAPNGRGSTVLYLSPTKALAHDQGQALRRLGIDSLRSSTYDGDTPDDERAWIRQHVQYLLTNPDLLHHSLLPGHERWSSFLRALRYVVVDECHAYRGLFGAHVSNVLRRLRRVAHTYGADPVFILASATVADPAVSASRLIGAPVTEVTTDSSPRGPSTVLLWEPPLLHDLVGEGGAPVRRSVLSETADLLTDLVVNGTRTLAFVRSRRGAETVAGMAREWLAAIDPSLPQRVAAYRGGYLPEERRALEADLRSGALLGVATTSALELGIDVHGLDAVLTAGWPGTRASWWQQMGRAGRAGDPSLAVLIARDDPLDTYLVAHPEALFDSPVEATVFDPANTHVMAPHLLAAAAEIPLTESDFADGGVFGPAARPVVEQLTQTGWLRARTTGWFWTRTERATDYADLRGIGGGPVRIVEEVTGRVLGTVDAAASHMQVHTGAVYVHQGLTHVITNLDLDEAVAHAVRENVDYTTHARELSDTRLGEVLATTAWGPVAISYGAAEVTSQVVGYLRRRHPSGEVIGDAPLDLPARTLATRAVWFTLPQQVLDAAELAPEDVPGAAHAAEHAAIALLPLVAGCDRWDIGGLSTAHHPDTSMATVIVHDGYPGGAGFAERGFTVMREWLTATRDAIAACECTAGCPSCVQSPKCGNGNDPLDKAGAQRLLDVMLKSAP